MDAKGCNPHSETNVTDSKNDNPSRDTGDIESGVDIDEQSAVGPDFSTLPDVTWVRVLSHLPLPDRYTVSQTCRTLLDVFNHPSLWRSQHISFIGREDNYQLHVPTLLGSNRYMECTKRYGKYFQHLTIEVHGHLRTMSGEWAALLHLVGSQCRLESLTLAIGKLTNRYHEGWGFPPEESCITPLISFIKNAFRMRRLCIRSWPMFEDIYQNPACNIFHALTANPKLRDLEQLSLFSLKNSEWSEREPKLINPSAILNTISLFKNLTHLSLRSPMIDKALFEELSSAERIRLKVFQITVHYLATSLSRDFDIPEIPTQVWDKLIQHNPTLNVELFILLKVPQLELANLVKPNVPLSAITYMKYAAIDALTLASLQTHYNHSLTKFLSYCESTDYGESLTAIVAKSPNLKEFIYHGEIPCATVKTIAKIRGGDWKTFEVKRSSLTVPDEYTDIDEDEVISRRADGELFLVDLMRFHQPEAYRTGAILAMETDVSTALGYTWTASRTS